MKICVLLICCVTAQDAVDYYNQDDSNNTYYDEQILYDLATAYTDFKLSGTKHKPHAERKEGHWTHGDGHIHQRKLKWDKYELTYKVGPYPKQWTVTNSDVEESVRKVFATWTAHTNLVIRPAEEHQQVDINISFISRLEGYFKYFIITPVVGYTYYPPNSSVFIDWTFPWDSTNGSGSSLFRLLVHEFGHSLGLGHSSVDGSIMLPKPGIQGYDPDFQLNDDDIQGIQVGKPLPNYSAIQSCVVYQLFRTVELYSK